MGLVENILNGEEKSAARLISQIENGEKEAYKSLTKLLPYIGKAHVIGITGPAGAGKSSITGHLAVYFADDGKKPAVISTDPTSIKGKGALLGDRLRMKEAEERNIFIRSMAHRGYPGGVARAAMGAVYVLEGLGKDVIIIESTGAGQSEKELFFLCDTVVAVFTPDFGDDIQLMKAGLIEIGDIIVVNKSDKTGASEAMLEIKSCLSLLTEMNGWKVPLISTQADIGNGIDELSKAIEAHQQNVDYSGRKEEKKREKIKAFLSALMKEELWTRFTEKLDSSAIFTRMLDDITTNKIDPYSAIEIILNKINNFD